MIFGYLRDKNKELFFKFINPVAISIHSVQINRSDAIKLVKLYG